jgi:GTPase SAR1 family protein
MSLGVGELLASLSPEPGLVVLMCGMAGSGKTTFSQRLEASGFTRLSIDEEVWQRFGRYGIDYPSTGRVSRGSSGNPMPVRSCSRTCCRRSPPGLVTCACSWFDRPTRSSQP